MTTTTTQALTAAEVKAEVLAFAAEYPTPNVAKMVALAEAGVITWADAYGLAAKALAAGLAVVGQGTPTAVAAYQAQA